MCNRPTVEDVTGTIAWLKSEIAEKGYTQVIASPEWGELLKDLGADLGVDVIVSNAHGPVRSIRGFHTLQPTSGPRDRWGKVK